MPKPMPVETLTALQGSIRKWEMIVAGTGGDGGALNCPLCDLFFDSEGDDEENPQGYCYGCPVSIRAKDTGCGNTPYTDWTAAFPDEKFPPELFADTPERKALAQAELDFLRSLLPENQNA